MKVVVVGAGIIGAALAERLAAGGAEVVVVEAAAPGGLASAASFGWINGSFYHDAAHHRLRVACMAAWHRRAAEGALAGLSWEGCVRVEAGPEELEAQAETLERLGYPAERLDRSGLEARGLGHIAETGLALPAEGVAEAAQVARALLARSGARVLSGMPVEALVTAGSSVRGVMVPGGAVMADVVVLAAGVATGRLAAQAGVAVPMLTRPGIVLRTRAVSPCLRGVLVAAMGEIRQDAAGRLVASTVAGHQGDRTDVVPDGPERITARTLRRLRALFPGRDLAADSLALADRPMPRDGLPVVGHGPPGLYVTVMHSGVTLAAGVAEMAASEILRGQRSSLLATYRARRFMAQA